MDESESILNITSSIADLMMSLNQEEAAILAATITDMFNRKLCGQMPITTIERIDSGLWEKCYNILDPIDANLNSLTLGWQAYRLVQIPELNEIRNMVESAELVASLPFALKKKMSPVIEETGIYEGSLLEKIAEIISEATEHVQIVNPYWSKYGVEPILRRLDCFKSDKIRFDILTQKNLTSTDKTTLRALYSHLRNLGTEVTVSYLDCDDGYGNDSLMHAKTVVVDRKKAYIGSANLTGNGMSLSVELGIIIEGLWPERLSRWVEALKTHLIEMELIV